MIPADQAVEELIQKYGKLVFHTIYGMTGDWEESQDLTQDTFHQALKAIDAARTASGSQFREKAWLMSIALNTVRMQRRRRGLFRFIPFSHLQKGTLTTEKAYDTGIETLNERAAPVQPAGYGAGESEDPADLRQRLTRARKQFQRLYVLENGEQINDNGTPAPSTSITQGQVGTRQNHEGRVESCVADEEELLDTPSSISRRNYGEQLYRNPAVTPLW